MLAIRKLCFGMLIFAIVAYMPNTANIAKATSNMRTDQLMWKCQNMNSDSAESMEQFVKKYGDAMRCLGYIDGIIDGHAIISGIKRHAKLFCLPQDGISIDQAVRVFMRWTNDNPKELHSTARVSVIMALRDAFPCQ